MSEASVTSFTIGGIGIQVFGLKELSDRQKQHPKPVPVGVLFLLHGRFGNSKEPYLVRIANGIIAEAETHPPADRARELLVVILDQRNHGDRVVDPKRNEGWDDEGQLAAAAHGKVDPKLLSNLSHLHDMYALYTGTCNDVSFLITHLQPLIFPHDEQTIDKWMVMGISLGGHASWHIGAHDPRISLLIPVVGSPAYLELLGNRAAGLGLPLEPPYLPNSLKRVLEQDAPKVQDFKGKEILVLSGAEDNLVAFDKSGSKSFIEQLEKAGVCHTLEVWVQPGVGHSCTKEMVERAINFIWAKSVQPAGNEPVPSVL